MSLLNKIQRGVANKPPRILVYGTEGIGKTTCASQAPSPIFIQTEDGMDQIASDRFDLARSYDDVYANLRDIHQEPHDYETLVIDSLDWLERLIFDRLCEQFGVTSIEKVDGGYGKGYTHATSVWREFISLLDAIRADRQMAIILLAHSKIERFEDPESSPYDRYSPRLHRNASALVCEWCDAVLFATRKIRTQSEDTGFNRKRTIAQPIGRGGGDRILRCVGGPSCVAKNRYGITDDLPLSWPAFMAAIQSSPLSLSST